MKAQRAIALLPLLLVLLAGCGERAPDAGAGGSTTPPYVRAEADEPMAAETTPVRIGELGANFAACNGRGAVRERAGGGSVPVRAAPYEPAAEIDRLEPGATFSLCARSHDQRWFGIVYDQDGASAARCGVAAPVPSRRDYQGPCKSGWVASARVRLVTGAAQPLPEAPPPPTN